MARCAKNRLLYEPPGESAHKNRKYGQRARRPSEWLEKGKGRRKGWRTVWVTVRGRAVRLVHRTEGPYLLKGAPECPVFLIVDIKGVDLRAKSRRREPTFYLVNGVPNEDGGGSWSMPYPTRELLSWAWQRWEAEVAHREMKSGFGLGEIQCWGARSTVMAARWQAWSYGVMVLAGFRGWGLGVGPACVRPAGRWRGYRQELWGLAGFRPLWRAIVDDYHEKEVHLRGMSNAVMGSMRG